MFLSQGEGQIEWEPKFWDGNSPKNLWFWRNSWAEHLFHLNDLRNANAFTSSSHNITATSTQCSAIHREKLEHDTKNIKGKELVSFAFSLEKVNSDCGTVIDMDVGLSLPAGLWMSCHKYGLVLIGKGVAIAGNRAGYGQIGLKFMSTYLSG